MHFRQSVLVFVLALAGCMKPNPLIYTLGDEGEDASGSETGEGDAGDGETGESALPDLSDGELCEPLESFDLGCGECLALDCCELALACADIDECLCLADCTLEGGKPGNCKNACGGVSPSDIAELAPLLECATAACNQAC